MYFVLGVLTAGLLALTVTPAIWRRASRLTRARVESTVPMSLAEIRADKDQLRAEFAIATRRLETNIGKLEEKTTGQTIDLDRRRNEITRLTSESAARAQSIRQLEERVAVLDAEMAKSGERIDLLRGEIAARDQNLATRAGRIAALEIDLEAAMQLTEEQKLELVARDTEIGNFRDEVSAARIAHSTLSLVRDDLAGALASEQAGLVREKQRGEGLEARIAALESERADRLALLERRAAEIREHETEIAHERAEREVLAAEVARLEADRAAQIGEAQRYVAEIDRLRTKLGGATAQQRETEARLAAAEALVTEARAEMTGLTMKAEAHAVTAGDNMQKSIAAGEAEKTVLAQRIAALEGEHEALRAENAELRRVAGAEWESERLENGRLRERLASIAADVVRMTQNGAALLEDGNGATRLQRPPPRPAENGEPAPRPSEGKTLAERIRALQHSAARH